MVACVEAGERTEVPRATAAAWEVAEPVVATMAAEPKAALRGTAAEVAMVAVRRAESRRAES